MLQVTVNGKEEEASEGETLSSLAKRISIAADVYIRNGFAVDGTLPLREGDQITLIEKGKLPDKAQLECMMAARHTPFVHEQVKKATVGIAGLGLSLIHIYCPSPKDTWKEQSHHSPAAAGYWASHAPPCKESRWHS